MPTLNAVILPAKVLKGGKHKVRISVAHNGEIRYINTNIILDDKSEFKNGAVRKRHDAAYLNTKIRSILNKYSQAIDEMDVINCLTCSELVSSLKNDSRGKPITFRQAMEEFISVKPMSDATKSLYRIAVESFCLYAGDVSIANINHGFALKFVKSMRLRKIKDSSIYLYISKLKSLLNYVKKCGYLKSDTNPFACLELKASEPRDCWLSVEEIRTIRDLNPHREKVAFYRDIFMLSYYLGGINIVDLRKINLSGNMISYVRTKTEYKANNKIEFRIPDEARTIINRVASSDGRLKLQLSERSFCGTMKTLGKCAGIPNLIYYSARKSFAQHAYSLGISENVIDYILGHSISKSRNRGNSCFFHYASVTPEMATDAIRKVLDNLAEK